MDVSGASVSSGSEGVPGESVCVSVDGDAILFMASLKGVESSILE